MLQIPEAFHLIVPVIASTTSRAHVILNYVSAMFSFSCCNAIYDASFLCSFGLDSKEVQSCVEYSLLYFFLFYLMEESISFYPFDLVLVFNFCFFVYMYSVRCSLKLECYFASILLCIFIINDFGTLCFLDLYQPSVPI